jgi:hypothetical protein
MLSLLLLARSATGHRLLPILHLQSFVLPIDDGIYSWRKQRSMRTHLGCTSSCRTSNRHLPTTCLSMMMDRMVMNDHDHDRVNMSGLFSWVTLYKGSLHCTADDQRVMPSFQLGSNEMCTDSRPGRWQKAPFSQDIYSHRTVALIMYSVTNWTNTMMMGVRECLAISEWGKFPRGYLNRHIIHVLSSRKCSHSLNLTKC